MKKKISTLILCLLTVSLGLTGCTRTQMNEQIAESIGTLGMYENNEPVETPKMKAEKEISNVQITADVDLAYPMYAFRHVPPADRTVKGLTVSVHNADGWHTVGKITDNFRRLIRVKFPPVKADEVKITVTDTLGVNYAKIYDIRIYE